MVQCADRLSIQAEDARNVGQRSPNSLNLFPAVLNINAQDPTPSCSKRNIIDRLTWLHLCLYCGICPCFSACECLTGPNTKEKNLNLGCSSKQIEQRNMETIGEIIPFAKEMLNQRPSRGMLKIYMLGSTLAMLGLVGGLVETVLLPFVEQETTEDTPAELIMKEKKDKKQMLKSHTTVVHPDVVDVPETTVIEVKAKYLATFGQRSSANRLHAS
ncbi:G0/G1 switch protein 2 G0S2-like protein [Larimichthys crocea]|uniref:G0/G1 switch protein 2 G0S2-like protein n=2 Tax=Larimichthys crocea TaxID=215358 RepID=A0A6G0IML1_LARCR|nr:G0/G1 switch protein 2 G0S2-like protein [Larimichthys crocea]